MIRILITDDHPLIRDGIDALISSVMPECECHEASSLAETLETLATEADFDLILLDLDLPDAKQLEALGELDRRYPGLPVAILSGNRDPILARAALSAGAVGFISKSEKPDRFLDALRSILEQGAYHDERLELNDPEDAKVRARLGSLTPQQRAVFKLIVDGQVNKQIAWELGISVATVKAHVSAVLAKLGVATRTQAALLSKRHHLFP